jgi:pyruvate dehydrogenase (quinone)
LGKAVIPNDSSYSLGGVLVYLELRHLVMLWVEQNATYDWNIFSIHKLSSNPGQARGIQIDIKPEKSGLRYPVEMDC